MAAAEASYGDAPMNPRCFIRLSAGAALLTGLASHPAGAEVITRLPGGARVVALTFDACEAGQRARLDHSITDYLIARGIPFTVFAGGKFSRDNQADMKALASHSSVEIENHSWSHNNNMSAKSDAFVRNEVILAEQQIRADTGRETRFFRFPAGRSDARTQKIVESLGYRIVHWRWASGDPAKGVSANQLVKRTLDLTRAGDILIFHVNGRGWNTGAAMPRIVEGLSKQGYRFVLLSDVIKAPAKPAKKKLMADAGQASPSILRRTKAKARA
jgi:peptidoglycan/xylan/chitin deacetylase (PgdA/CDA1 family)